MVSPSKLLICQSNTLLLHSRRTHKSGFNLEAYKCSQEGFLTQITQQIHKNQPFEWGQWSKRKQLPPLHHMWLIIPVLSGSVRINICVNSGPAWHGSRHVRQVGEWRWTWCLEIWQSMCSEAAGGMTLFQTCFLQTANTKRIKAKELFLDSICEGKKTPPYNNGLK